MRTAVTIILTFSMSSYFVRGAERDFDALRPRLRGTPAEIARAREFDVGVWLPRLEAIYGAA